MVYLSYSGLEQLNSDISRSTFARGLSELMEKQFIAAQQAVGWFWVNPDFMWNGDRLTFVREYRRQGTKATDPRQRALPLEGVMEA